MESEHWRVDREKIVGNIRTMKDHAGLPMGEGSSKWKPHVNVGQGLGRLFRPGAQLLVISNNPPIEAQVVARIKDKIVLLDDTEPTISLAERIRDDVKRLNQTPAQW